MNAPISSKKIAIVGSGPAALMAAHVVAANPGQAGAANQITVFEKRKSAGRKLLVAGSSGLNITNSAPLAEFAKYYSGPEEFWNRVLRVFTPEAWIRFIESLGIPTFEGTSGRYFIEDMKGSKFLQAWTRDLIARGVEFRFDHELVGFERAGEGLRLDFSGGKSGVFDAVCFCLGGASWEPSETPLRWPAIFRRHGLGFEDFAASNCGYQVAWSAPFLAEAEGLPLKSVVMSSTKGSRKGDAMITKYGIEGTPVYFVGLSGPVTIDLKPDLTIDQIVARLSQVKENLSPIRRVKKLLGLCPGSYALLFHSSSKEVLNDPALLPIASQIKALSLVLGDAQPLTEAISSSGGLKLNELDDQLMLKKFPGFFAAGEMLDWDVPTGGFLIQGSVSQGYCAGQGMLSYLK